MECMVAKCDDEAWTSQLWSNNHLPCQDCFASRIAINIRLARLLLNRTKAISAGEALRQLFDGKEEVVKKLFRAELLHGWNQK